MKKLIPFAVMLLFALFSYGQSLSPEVISSGGDFSQGANASLSWTLGELATETLTGGNVILTQGFQQNSFTITSIDESLFTDFSVILYPNPVKEFLNIQIDSQLDKSYRYELVDLSGSSILTGKITNNYAQISLSNKSLSSRMYIIRILDESNKMVKGFKLLKAE